MEIGLLCLVFNLPYEVELIIKRLSRARPLLSLEDCNSSRAKNYIKVFQENGRHMSIDRSTGDGCFKQKCIREWGKGNSKNKQQYQLYYRAVCFALDNRAVIKQNLTLPQIVEYGKRIEEEIKRKSGATGCTDLLEIRGLKIVYHELMIRGAELQLEEMGDKPKKYSFKKLTLKSFEKKH